MKKVLGILSVAPVRPAIDINVKSSDCENAKPRLSICTVMMPHISQTANPQSRLGIEIQRFLVAIFLPVEFQNSLSSTSHFLKSLIV